MMASRDLYGLAYWSTRGQKEIILSQASSAIGKGVRCYMFFSSVVQHLNPFPRKAANIPIPNSETFVR